jgi:hypothetical protein
MIGSARRREGKIAVSLMATAGLLGCDVLGLGSEPDSVFTEPVEVAPGQRFVDVGAGWMHSCATGTSGGVYCWGKGETGETGATPSGVCRGSPMGDVPCTGVLQPLVDAPPLHSLGGGLYHTCGLDAQGRAWCWGLTGFLGDGVAHQTPVSGPVRCEGPPEMGLTCRGSAAPVSGGIRFNTLQVSLEGGIACAVDLDGAGWCWGMGGAPRMGGEASLVPTPLPTPLRFQDLLVRQLVGCGLVEGAAWCWGSNWQGTLGSGSPDTGTTPDPVEVTGGHTFAQLSATGSSICALRTDGTTMCWGHLPTLYGSAGAEWYGRSPVPAGGPSMVSIYGGAQHHCGLTSSGEAWCWGGNSSGALGDGSRSERDVPVRVRAPGGVRFTHLALGGGHTCGLAADGRLFCWGDNSLGQVGRTPPKLR